MKKLVVAVIAVAVASSAMAGVLQVGQTAAAVEPGAITATAGFALGLGDLETKTIGARCSMGAIESLLVVVDVGYEIEGEVVNAAIAGQYTLPVELPVDLAIRLDYTLMDVPEFEITDFGAISIAVQASAPIEQVAGLAVYGGIGYWYPLMDGADGELVLNVGGTYDLPVENLSMYAELTYVEDPTIGAGVVWAFQ
jgi:hypothetical protein